LSMKKRRSTVLLLMRNCSAPGGRARAERDQEKTPLGDMKHGGIVYKPYIYIEGGETEKGRKRDVST
jgi:hypothetical protein